MGKTGVYSTTIKVISQLTSVLSVPSWSRVLYLYIFKVFIIKENSGDSPSSPKVRIGYEDIDRLATCKYLCSSKELISLSKYLLLSCARH